MWGNAAPGRPGTPQDPSSSEQQQVQPWSRGSCVQGGLAVSPSLFQLPPVSVLLGELPLHSFLWSESGTERGAQATGE